MDKLLPGTVTAYAGSADNLQNLESQGWLLCDGKPYDGTKPQYKALFDVVRFCWGGDNGNIFHVPDLRGQFIRGVSGQTDIDPDANGRGPSHPGLSNPGNSGNMVGSSQGHAFKKHQHATSAGNNPADASGVNYLPVMGTFIKNIMTGEPDAGGGSETRPVNKAVYYIIKL